MEAAVMSFHLSLSSTSSSSLTRFRPVIMQYNDKLALFKSFSILLSIHRCFGRPTGCFPVGFQLWTMDGHLSLFILEICQKKIVHTISFSFYEQCSLLFPALFLLAPLHCLLYPYISCAVSDAVIGFSHAFSLFSMTVVKLQVSLP